MDLPRAKEQTLSDLFNTRAARVKVDRVIVPNSVQEISRVFQDNSLVDESGQITVVGGGHSTLCTKPGAIVIDLRNSIFRKVGLVENKGERKEDDDYLLVDFGGGATIADLSRALKGSGWSVPVGTYGSVGAGLVLQGGIGFLTRQFGLTIDRIVEADLVTGTGERICLVNENHGDLFWALKGAGNQLGAVVTRICLKAVPIEMLSVCRILLKVSTASLEQHLADLLALAVDLPNTDTLGFLVRKIPEDLLLMIVHTSTQTSRKEIGESIFATRLSKSDGMDTVLFRDCQIISYHDTDGLFGFPEPFASNGVDFDGKAPLAAIHCDFLGGKYFSKSTSILAKELVEQLERAQTCNGKMIPQIDFQHTGGAIKSVSPTHSAFWNRDQEFSCVICCLYSETGAGRDNIERMAFEWIDKVKTAITEQDCGVKAGCYSVDIMRQSQTRSNFSTKSLLEASYGENWNRIRAVQNQLDPNAVMRPHGD
jgi:hypothetical protein